MRARVVRNVFIIIKLVHKITTLTFINLINKCYHIIMLWIHKNWLKLWLFVFRILIFLIFFAVIILLYTS